MDKKVLITIGVVILIIVLLPILPKVLKGSPAPNPELDASNAQRLQAAVNSYAQQTGYLPQSLSLLVPDYVESLPSATTGQPFGYDARSGTVTNPNPAQGGDAPTRARRGGGAAGSGPMGEAMTGIGMMEEMN